MKTIAAAVSVVILFCCSSVFAQEASSQPAATSSTTPASDANNAPAKQPELTSAITPRAEQPHRFFDAKNTFAAGAFAVGLAGDSWSTQRALAYPRAREANPLARPFVSSSAGEAVYSASSLGFLLGGMYLAHKTHHHKLERVVPWALAGWEGFLTAWNLHQISRLR